MFYPSLVILSKFVVVLEVLCKCISLTTSRITDCYTPTCM